MAYVYLHRRKSDGSIFYVGVGGTTTGYQSTNRYRRRDDRDAAWNLIVKEHGFYPEILKGGITIEEALALEEETIKKYGKIKDGTGILTNVTDGGLGVKGFSKPAWNKGKKLHYDVWLKGKKMDDAYRKRCSEIQKKRIAENGHHMQGRKQSPEAKRKMRESHLGKKISESHIRAMTASRLIKIGKFINGVLIESYNSLGEAARKNGVSGGYLSRLLNKKVKIPKKYNYEIKRL